MLVCLCFVSFIVAICLCILNGEIALRLFHFNSITFGKNIFLISLYNFVLYTRFTALVRHSKVNEMFFDHSWTFATTILKAQRFFGMLFKYVSYRKQHIVMMEFNSKHSVHHIPFIILWSLRDTLHWRCDPFAVLMKCCQPKYGNYSIVI